MSGPRHQIHLRRLILVGISCLLGIALAEFLARAAGHQPWRQQRAEISVSPGNKFYRTHPTLGYTHLPGRFIVTLNGSYTFTATNLDNTLRATRPENESSSKKPEIWVFGDSVTYGWSVNDEQAYCWILQRDMPDYEFVNFGVDGYGTLQSLIQLQEALPRNKPQLVILTYASWQNVRNTFVRAWKKLRTTSEQLGDINQPYAELSPAGELNLLFDSAPYYEPPLVHKSALVNLLDEAFNSYEMRHAQSEEVTRRIAKQFVERCRQEGIDLIVATITRDATTRDIAEHFHGLGIKTVDIYVDLTIKENNNQPFDSHPSAVAHAQYAEKLKAYLNANR